MPAIETRSTGSLAIFDSVNLRQTAVRLSVCERTSALFKRAEPLLRGLIKANIQNLLYLSQRDQYVCDDNQNELGTEDFGEAD